VQVRYGDDESQVAELHLRRGMAKCNCRGHPWRFLDEQLRHVVGDAVGGRSRASRMGGFAIRVPRVGTVVGWPASSGRCRRHRFPRLATSRGSQSKSLPSPLRRRATRTVRPLVARAFLPTAPGRAPPHVVLAGAVSQAGSNWIWSMLVAGASRRGCGSVVLGATAAEGPGTHRLRRRNEAVAVEGPSCAQFTAPRDGQVRSNKAAGTPPPLVKRATPSSDRATARRPL